MATLEKRISKQNEVTYRVRIRRKGLQTISKTFRRKSDAKKFVRSIETKIDEGTHLVSHEATKHTLSDAIERYILNVLPDKPKSQKKQTQQLGWWHKELGHLKLSAISPAQIAEHRDKLSQGVTNRGFKRTPATVNRYLAALSHMFTIAVKEWGWIDANPVSKVRKLKEARGRVRYLDDDERERLIKACKNSPNPYLYVIVMLALATGGRRNEIIGLTRNDIDMKQKLITFYDTKNGAIRSIPITGFAYNLLAQHLKVHSLHTNLLFPSKRVKNQPIDIRKSWDKAIRETKINDFRFHDLRHSSASYLAMNGASVPEIAEILGHKTLQMVKRYTHLSKTHLHDVMDRMNEKMFKR